MEEEQCKLLLPLSVAPKLKYRSLVFAQSALSRVSAYVIAYYSYGSQEMNKVKLQQGMTFLFKTTFPNMVLGASVTILA